MRVDIDQKDIANALADTRKKFGRAAAGLVVSLGLLAGIFLASGFGLWRASAEIWAAIMAAAPAPSFHGLLFAYRTEPGLFTMAGAWAAGAIMSALVIAAVLKARRNRAAALKQEALAHPLTSGRFEFVFSAEKLAVSGPFSMKKISWNTIAKIENRKSSIVFHHKDGRYDFIPKNVVPNDNFYDLMMVKHGPALNKACPYEEAHLTKPLSVTFETARGDNNDYYAHYFKKRDGRLYFLRRLAQWRPWAPFVFLILLALAAASGYAAFNSYSLVQAGVALGALIGAAAIFVLNSAYFRGPAHPFRKSGGWPYAQTSLATVTLSKDGVFYARHGASDFVRWAAVSTYVESKLFGYLVIAPKEVIALPKRAFLDKAHFDDFTLYAKRSMTLAKKQKSEDQRGRMMRSLGDKPEAAKPVQLQLPAPKQPATAPQAAPKTAPQPVKAAGPSPRAAPAQIMPAPAAKSAQAKPAQAKPAQAKPLQAKPQPVKTAPQQTGAAQKTPAAEPALEPAPVKRKVAKPAPQTLAILNSALKKAAELDALSKQKQEPLAEPPEEKKTAAE